MMTDAGAPGRPLMSSAERAAERMTGGVNRSGSYRHLGRALSRAACAGAVLACLCCFAQARQLTPEAVAPPPSLQSALDEAKEALKLDQAQMPAASAGTIGINEPVRLELTRDGAVLSALARNPSLVVQRLTAEISSTNVQDARAQFDPALQASASYRKDSSVSSGATSSTVVGSGGQPSHSRQYQSEVTVSEYLPTGTEVYLSGGMSRSRPDSTDWTYTGSWSAGINQSLLRGFGLGPNLVALRQARNAEAVSQQELRSFVLELVHQVEVAYWELVLATETLKIREFSVQLASEQLKLNEDMIAVGKLSGDARVSAEAELASQEADLVDARAAVKGQAIDLIRLVNPEAEVQWELSPVPVDPPEVQSVDVNAQVSARLADMYRPELIQSRLSLANRQLEVEKTRNELLPKLDMFASYSRLSSGATTRDATRHLDDNELASYEIGLSLGLSPLNRSERAGFRRAELDQQKAEASIENLKQLIEAGVRQDVIEVQRQWERVRSTQQVVKSRAEQLEVEKSKFLVGKSTNLDVSLVQRDLIEAQLAEVTARIKYIESLTGLYLGEGTLLIRRGVGPDYE